jgi:hypothetical protein
MKQIEEEWKTIEEFPNYEISNFGRCRHKVKMKIRKKLICISPNGKTAVSYYFMIKQKEGFRGKSTSRSAGMLVAKAFVENPNNCKSIEYIDGDTFNCIFTNIRWVQYYNKDLEGCRALSRPKDESKEYQLKYIRKKIELALRFEKALIEGTEIEFIYGELKQICANEVYRKFPYKNEDFKQEMIATVLELFADLIKRGRAPISIDYYIKTTVMRVHREYRKQLKTVEIDERRI